MATYLYLVCTEMVPDLIWALRKSFHTGPEKLMGPNEIWNHFKISRLAHCITRRDFISDTYFIICILERTPEQTRLARSRSGLDFQILKVEAT